MNNCKHNKVTFTGAFSMIGNYHCDECGEIIDPVEYARLKGDLNIKLLDYYTQNPEKLKPEWRSHNWVKHLYEFPT